MPISDVDLPRRGTAPAGDHDPLTLIAEIARRRGLAGIEERCRAAQLQADGYEVTVAVLGQFKAGKTSLLNALLGQELLPVQAVPATAVITRLRFGEHLCAWVTPTQGGAFPIEVESLAEWITETGNPANGRGVAHVDVDTPDLADLDHLVLVDTPGTGSTWEHNTETSMRWLPQVGAALVAVNATQPLSKDDLALIELIAPHTPTLLIVLTKIDLLTPQDLQAVTAHVRRQLQSRTHTEPTILPVSNTSRHRPERERLRSFLRELNLTHSGVSDRLLAHRTVQLAADCSAFLKLAQASAASKSAALDQLRDALAAEVDRLPTLAQQCRAQLQPIGQAMIETTQHQVRAAVAHSVAQVGQELVTQLPSWRGSLAAETARFRLFLRQSLTNQLTAFSAQIRQSLESHMEEGLEPVRRMGEAFLQRLGGLVSAGIGHELVLPSPEPARTPIEPVDIALNRVFESHLELLSWAVPMPLARRAVHRHFLSMLPWEVEKNLNRTAYSTVAAARRCLQLSLDAYLSELAAIVRTCQRVVDTEPDQLESIEAELGQLEAIISAARVGADAAS